MTCSWGMQCDTKRELSDTQPGGYKLENVSAICEDGLRNYCGQGLTTIAIQCSFSGGGGGGGKGGGYDGNGSCYSDWDCDSGYSCGGSGYCEEDEDWIS